MSTTHSGKHRLAFVLATTLLAASAPFVGPPSAASAATQFVTAARPDRTTAAVGDPIAVTVSVTANEATRALIDFEVYDSGGRKVYQEYWANHSLESGRTRQLAATWPTAGLIAGEYTLKVGVFSGWWESMESWNNDAATVVLAPSPSTTPPVVTTTPPVVTTTPPVVTTTPPVVTTTPPVVTTTPPVVTTTPPVVTTTPPVVTTTPTGNTIPAAQLPRGIAGSDQVLIRSSPQQGESGDVSGNFRFICGMSHMAYDDPIVFPNQPGRSHLHVFFGNTGTNASSTYQSLRSSGNGTCSGGIANRSSYWMPALMNAGVPVVPDHLQVYYKSGYRRIAPSQINNVPNGLRIVAGTASATTDQSSEIVEWFCTNGGGVDQHMVNCGAGGEMQMGIIFPQCWDGVNLDSADHKSHMAYPGSGSNFGAGCPGSHAVAIPVITMTQFFNQPAGVFSNLRLSSDPAGAPAGVSSHADYFEAWDPTIRDGWTQHCVREHRDCTRGLGDARQLVDPPGI